MSLAMLAEVEFAFFFQNYDQLCLVTLRVRASYLRVWFFEGIFYAQWKPRILMALTILAEVEFSFFFSKCWSAVPYHFARAGVVFESLYCWGHFSCSVTAENPNGIDDVGRSWVFDVWRCWLKFSVRVCFLNDAACGVSWNWVVHFGRAGVVFESVNFSLFFEVSVLRI